jgi:flagellar hook-associated protein 3 FlgL
MRIATSQVFDRPTARMASLSAQADKLQAQISTGKRVTNASDDAVAYRQLAGLDRADADDKAYGANIKLAQGLVAQTDGVLGSVEDRIQRAQELTIQAANGTLAPSDRAAVATELDSIIDDLMSLANTQDSRGQSVFGGGDGGPAYVRGSDGAITYAGTGQTSPIPVGDGVAVQPGVPGPTAFGDMFARLQAISAAVMTGDAPPADALDGLRETGDQLAAARASVGARGMRLDLEAGRLTDNKVDRDDSRTALDGVDVSASITELQKTLTILQATQASFTKLAGLSLFDYLR